GFGRGHKGVERGGPRRVLEGQQGARRRLEEDKTMDPMQYFADLQKPVIAFVPTDIEAKFRPGQPPAPGEPICVRGTILGASLPPGWTSTALKLSFFSQADPWVLAPLSAFRA